MIHFVTNQKAFDELPEGFCYSTVEDSLEYLSKLKYIGLDTETEGFDPYTKNLLTLQLGDFDNQYVIDLTTIDIYSYNELLQSEEHVFIIQNAKFDLRFLMRKNIWVKKVYDTFLAESILYQGLPYDEHPKGLDALAMKYCGGVLDKSIRGNIHYQGLSLAVIEYAAHDVKYLEKIMEAQEVRIREEELHRTLSLENEFVKVLAYIEMCGIRIDIPQWKKKMEDDKNLLNSKLEALNNYIISTPKFSKYVDNQLDLFSSENKCLLNWSSPKQVVGFFEELGLNLSIKDKRTGLMKKSVDAKVLQPQKDKDPVVPIYLEYKQAEKVVSTYGENWLKQVNSCTGRLHTQFKQLIDTGRLSSGGKNQKTKEEYINFLNIPQDNKIRNCIIPKDGYVFIDCDYSGLQI